jgi:hypothetical protein
MGLTEFAPSSSGWPPYMRVNPILDWTYRSVILSIKKLVEGTLFWNAKLYSILFNPHQYASETNCQNITRLL